METLTLDVSEYFLLITTLVHSNYYCSILKFTVVKKKHLSQDFEVSYFRISEGVGVNLSPHNQNNKYQNRWKKYLERIDYH